MSVLWSIGILLCVRIGNRLVKSTPHSYMVGKICGESAIEIRRTCLEMGCESSILQWQVVIFFFVHLFIDNILLGHPQRTTSPPFMDFRGPARRLDSCLQTSIASPRSRDIGSEMSENEEKQKGVD